MLLDALSRREQDLPARLDNDRLADRFRKILEPNEDNQLKLRVYVTWTPRADFDLPGDKLSEAALSAEEREDPPEAPFVDPELRSL